MQAKGATEVLRGQLHSECWLAQHAFGMRPELQFPRSFHIYCALQSCHRASHSPRAIPYLEAGAVGAQLDQARLQARRQRLSQFHASHCCRVGQDHYQGWQVQGDAGQALDGPRGG